MGAAQEKFLVNFQGFQADLNMEEDFSSCQQYERETLPDFFCRFLRLKAQASGVSDEVITEAIKALRVSQLHNNLVRECQRTLEELYDNFRKFSRSEVLHFHKLGQQRKIINENESSRPAKYSRSRESALSLDTLHKQVHNIDLDGCGPLENWEKNFRPSRLESENRVYDSRRDHHHPRGGYSSQDRRLYCMFHERGTNHQTMDCPIFLQSRKKMTQ
jgi:hypothetical protein